jgi:ubiquinol-cytochrome c reductase iron-sulfur subunit
LIMAKKAEPKKAAPAVKARAKPKAAAKTVATKAPVAAKAVVPKAPVPAKTVPAKTVAVKPVPAKTVPATKPVATKAPVVAKSPAPAKPAATVPVAPVVAPKTVAIANTPAASDAPASDADHAPTQVRRRDFINIAAMSFAGVGAVAIVLPLIYQMNPSADVLADSSTEIDVSQIQPGQAIKTIFRKQPLFVRHLKPEEIKMADAAPLSEMRDPQTLEQRTQPGKKQWLVTMGVCTHLGCVPLGAAAGEVQGEYKGYFCPCHGSSYDTAGRIRKGPAPANLMVPEYTFVSDTVIQVG